MDDFALADLCDDHVKSPTPVSVADACFFNDYGGSKKFWGEIVTIKCFESNPLVRELLSTPGKKKVLVIDGGGSKRCALIGDQIAKLGVANDWSGVIINGCLRDSAEIATLSIGVKAVGTIPVKSLKNNPGVANVTVAFAGVEFVPGRFVFCDEDGVIVSDTNILLKANRSLL